MGRCGGAGERTLKPTHRNGFGGRWRTPAYAGGGHDPEGDTDEEGGREQPADALVAADDDRAGDRACWGEGAAGARAGRGEMSFVSGMCMCERACVFVNEQNG